MPSVRYRLLTGMFKLIGLNKMLDKQGTDLEKLMQSYVAKQDNIKVPAEKISRDYDFEKKVVEGFDCYVTRKKGSGAADGGVADGGAAGGGSQQDGRAAQQDAAPEQGAASPKKALLYLFGGGYILPCDPGDFVLAGQFVDNTGRDVWFPIYPLAPRHKTVDAVRCVLAVYQEMLKSYAPEDIVFFGTSSGGGLVLSTLMYIKHEGLDVPMPAHLVLQSPGLQVPPSETQFAKMQELKALDVMIPPNFFNAIAPYLVDEDTKYLL